MSQLRENVFNNENIHELKGENLSSIGKITNDFPRSFSSLNPLYNIYYHLKDH